MANKNMILSAALALATSAVLASCSGSAASFQVEIALVYRTYETVMQVGRGLENEILYNLYGDGFTLLSAGTSTIRPDESSLILIGGELVEEESWLVKKHSLAYVEGETRYEIINSKKGSWTCKYPEGSYKYCITNFTISEREMERLDTAGSSIGYIEGSVMAGLGHFEFKVW